MASTQKSILKKLQFIGGSQESEQAMDAVGKKFGLEDEQVGVVSKAVGEVLRGKLHPNFLITQISKTLGVPRETARPISHEISQKIFAHVRNELVSLYGISPPGSGKNVAPNPESSAVSLQQELLSQRTSVPQASRPVIPPSPTPPQQMPKPLPAPVIPLVPQQPHPAPQTTPPLPPAPQQGAPAQKAETPFGPQEELMRLYRMARPGTSAPTEHEPAPPPPPSQKPVSPPTAAPQRTPANDAHPPVVDLRP